MTQAETDARRGSEAGEEPYVLDDQIGYLLRLANQRHTLIFQEHAVLELTPTQFSAMVRLLDEGECSQNELGRRTAMDVATVKGVVDRLRAKGLVRLRPDPTDRRRTTISILLGMPPSDLASVYRNLDTLEVNEVNNRALHTAHVDVIEVDRDRRLGVEAEGVLADSANEDLGGGR